MQKIMRSMFAGGLLNLTARVRGCLHVKSENRTNMSKMQSHRRTSFVPQLKTNV